MTFMLSWQLPRGIKRFEKGREASCLGVRGETNFIRFYIISSCLIIFSKTAKGPANYNTMLKLSEKPDSKTDTKILLDAISKDKVHLARFILDALDGKIIDSKSDGAQTPLISSVFLPDSSTRSKFMHLLLQKGANVNHQDEVGRTALSYACERGDLDAVKMLVKNNANPEMVDTWGNTALMYAAVAGHSLVVEFLVRAFKRFGLQIDRQNKVGNSAVEVARFLGHTECLSALMCSSKKVHDALCEELGNLSTNEDPNESEEVLKEICSELQTESQVTPSKSSAGEVRRVSVSSGRKRAFILRSKMKSMDSIEEFEKESDSLPPSPRGLAFSSGLKTPKPPLKSLVRTDACANSHLPPLFRGPESHNSLLYSPRPCKNWCKNLCKNSEPPIPPAGALSGPLKILLTPMGRVCKEEKNGDKWRKSNFTVRRFDDNYYQKRCSLPTSALSSAPQQRSAKPLRKSKTIVKNIANIEPQELSASQPSTSFSVLGNKLLRRFTFPDCKKMGEDARKGSCPSGAGEGEMCVRPMPRSETFPQSKNHPQVGSKPSIDSISAVKCEFDFQFKAAPSGVNF